jgi:hypothetical protein
VRALLSPLLSPPPLLAPPPLLLTPSPPSEHDLLIPLCP